MKKNPLQLLTDLTRLLNQDGTEYAVSWKSVPEEYKDEFRSWVGEVKQQDWSFNEPIGWQTYHLEFLRWVIDTTLAELDVKRRRSASARWPSSWWQFRPA